MTTYMIVIDDSDRDEVDEGTEWTAALYKDLAPDSAAPIVASGLGASPREALAELIDDARLFTSCPQGHPYDEENTYVARGKRHCRACGRERARATYRERGAA